MTKFSEDDLIVSVERYLCQKHEEEYKKDFVNRHGKNPSKKQVEDAYIVFSVAAKKKAVEELDNFKKHVIKNEINKIKSECPNFINFGAILAVAGALITLVMYVFHLSEPEKFISAGLILAIFVAYLTYQYIKILRELANYK